MAKTEKKKYGYEKLMEENDLTMDKLPSKAKFGIEAIANITRAIVMTEKKGKKVNDRIYEKIEANDEWVCHLILDSLLKENDPSIGSIPNPAPVVIEEIQIQAAAQPATASAGTVTDPTPSPAAATAATEPTIQTPNPAAPPAPATKKEYVADGDFLFGIMD